MSTPDAGPRPLNVTARAMAMDGTPILRALFESSLDMADLRIGEVVGAAVRFPSTVKLLMRLAFERASSILFLVQGRLLWDAEILSRALAETALKALFLCKCDSDEREQRLLEFWVVGRYDAILSRSNKAQEWLDSKGPDDLYQRVMAGLVLSEAARAEIRSRWSRLDRRAVASKWSFHAMVKELQAHDARTGGQTLVGILLHSYGMGSHFVHGDAWSIELLVDRATREPDEALALETAHAAGLVANALCFPALCGIALAKEMDSAPYPPFQESLQRMQTFLETLEPHHHQFLATQQQF